MTINEPWPLVIGAAGHRDPRPQDLSVLRERCRAVIAVLLEELPHTPLLMLNGLAAGMDSEAAEIFLELVADAQPHHQLVAALPKPRQLYLEEDFPLAGSEEAVHARQRLEALLSRCDAVLDGDNCPELRLPVSAAGQERDGIRLIRAVMAARACFWCAIAICSSPSRMG